VLRCFPCCVTTDTKRNLSLLSSPNSSRAFLDLDSELSDQPLLYFSLLYRIHFGTAFTTYYGAASLTTPPKRWALVCRSVRASADDKIVESEAVAPRVTPVAAARRSRPYPRAHPLPRIGDPSPYAPSPALPSVDPTVLRSYPLSFYKPKHSPEALVAIGTSLAGAQTTPPKTLLSSPNTKKLQKPPNTRPFTKHTTRLKHPSHR
jgi:hypothetical protein